MLGQDAEVENSTQHQAPARGEDSVGTNNLQPPLHDDADQGSGTNNVGHYLEDTKVQCGSDEVLNS